MAMSVCDLPIEILIMIMDKLQLEERLKARLVCHRFQLVVESQLKLVKSLQLTGRSLKSVLDFVKDSKAREQVVMQSVSSACNFSQHNSIDRIIRFDVVAHLISRYFTGLTSLRLNRLTITLDGMLTLLSSQSWNKMEYLVIRSCYVDDEMSFENFIELHDPKWRIGVNPISLKQMFHFPITNNHSLVQFTRLVVDSFKCESLPSGWLLYTAL
jgi:hypothetical protein